MNQSLATELSNLSIDIVPWQEVESLFQSKINPILPESPEYFLSPHTQKDLSEICQYAYQHDQPLITCGQGSKIGWGGLVNRKIKYIVSTRHLNKIIEHAQEDLTVTVEAGVKLADLQQTLQKSNQFLPLDVAYADTATIGGIIATADAGSLRQRYGGVRDLLLGITFVRADGAIAHAGGRVVKNVAGYDLMKLLTGSYGTLGTISEVTLRLYPIPPDSATILLSGSANQINQARQTILNSGLTPTAFDLISAAVVKQLEIADNMGLLIRFQTIPESIDTQTEQIEKLATKLNLKYQIYRSEPEKNLWKQLKSLQESGELITCKIGIIRDSAIDFLQDYAKSTNNKGIGVIHGGNGLGKLVIAPEDLTSPIQEIRLQCEKRQGYLTILNAPKTLKQNNDIWGYTGNGIKIMEQLKQQFDSKQVLNPGRFLGNI